MRLYARCLPEYFELLDQGKTVEFRQIECISLENSETHEQKTFLVNDIIRLTLDAAQRCRAKYSKVSWDQRLPIFAIELGEEIKIERVKSIEKAEIRPRDDDEEKYEFFNQRRVKVA